MRNIAELFTPGNGPSEAEIDAAHNFDRGHLQFLNLSVSNVRSAYVEFKYSQDANCARYEQEAEALVREFDRRETVLRASLFDRAAIDVCFPHVICELPLYQYFFLFTILFFMSYVPLTFLICMPFSVIL